MLLIRNALDRQDLARAARSLGWASIYCAAVAALTTVLFFSLHHLGNQLPYELAKERFKAEAAADRTDPGYTEAFKIRYEYCEMSAVVLAGSRSADDGNAFRNAVALKSLLASGCRDYCYLVGAESHGAKGTSGHLKTTHWWGNKALYAMALRHLSVAEIRDLTLISTRVAYVLLAFSLLVLGPRVLLVGAPLILFDAFSGIEYWADIANGLPYLWTILMATALALLMRTRIALPGLLASCFAGGTVSSYLWMGDGHTLLAIAWIGLLVWVRHDHVGVRERAGMVVSCIAFYTAGVIVSFGLAQTVKGIVMGYEVVWHHFSNASTMTARDMDADYPVWRQFNALLEAFYAMAWPSDPDIGRAYTVVTASSLLAAFGLTVLRLRQGSLDLLWAVLWIIALMLMHSLPQFLITDHMPYRAARFMFVPHALCWSCLFLAIQKTSWRLSSATLGALLFFALSTFWYFSDERVIGRLTEGRETADPVIRSTFDVYRTTDKLIYLRDDCRDEDLDSWFFLAVYPLDEADLPDWRVSYGFGNHGFRFGRYDHRGGFVREPVRGGYTLRGGGRCAAVRTLPDYEIAHIRTGQNQGDRSWQGVLQLASPDRMVDKLLRRVRDAPPVVSSTFDVYRDRNKLVYAKESCRGEDVGGSFFLHVYPTDPAELPSFRVQYGFDNLDFLFTDHGYVGGAWCAAERLLPDYEIDRIRTGQIGPGGAHLWSGEARIREIAP